MPGEPAARMALHARGNRSVTALATIFELSLPPVLSNLLKGIVVCNLLSTKSSMQRMVVRGGWMAWVLLAAVTAQSNADVLLTEFMAMNNTTLTDQDGQYSDWIEIYNQGPDTVNLDGWYLTDDSSSLTKWRFPATDLFPGSYQVVFASGKSRA